MNLYYAGGPIYMGMLTLLALILISISILAFIKQINNASEAYQFKQIRIVKELGLLSLVLGLFSMCVSFSGMFAAIEQAGDVSSAVLAGGMKVMMIPVIYGFILFLLSRAIIAALTLRMNKPVG